MILTLAIALRCSNGLIMASDSRVTGGARRSADISEKFLQINRDVGVMTYGLAEPGYDGIHRIVEEARQNPSDFTTMEAITSRAQAIFQQIYQNYTTLNRLPDGSLPPAIEQQGVGYIIGGYDGNDTAQFRIYLSESRGNNFQMNELGDEVLAAQWHLSSFLLPFFQYTGMSVVQGKKIAIMLMIITSKCEPTVGGPIHLATATVEEGFTVVPDHDVNTIIQDVQPLFATLKMAWLQAWCGE